MNLNQWTQVDSYIVEKLVDTDPVLKSALRKSLDAGLPPHQVSASQGKFLQLLAKACGARRILELGTLGGYSTIWLARGLPPDGRLVTLELNSKYADVARENIAEAGLSQLVEVQLGTALNSLAELAAQNVDPFDLIFIDADKQRSAEYFSSALTLARVGSVIIVDNVVRDGALVDARTDDPSVQGVRRLHELLAVEPRVSATTVQTVGSKGYDGFTMAVVTGK